MTTPMSAAYPKAPLGARALASFLDGMVGSAPLLVVLLMCVLLRSTPDITVLWAGIVWTLLGSVIWGIYYGFTKDGRRGGQSVGKARVGLMVVDTRTGAPCSTGGSALRALVLWVSNLIPFVGWLIEPIAVLVMPDGRRLGDRVAGTQVISVAAYQPPVPAAVATAADD